MKLGTAQVIRGNALSLPLENDSVDLCVTSPPYWSLRAYQDGGAAYDGQLGSETTASEFIDNLLVATREMVRVCKPTASIFVNLGDKFSDKSLMLLPQRYAIRCVDELGLILRAEIVWSKPNGLPESVTDRVRRSHEVWWHFTLSPRYFSAVDEVREPYDAPTATRSNPGRNYNRADGGGNPLSAVDSMNPLGKLPGSVWSVPTEPLRVPDHLGIDHFAAFPTEWPKRIIQGWSPAGVCVECGEGRRPVADSSEKYLHRPGGADRIGTNYAAADGPAGARHDIGNVRTVHRIAGYACACGTHTTEGTWITNSPASLGPVEGTSPSAGADGGASTTEPKSTPQPSTPPTRPAVVLDPFGGTGTTAMVAKALGRHGISIDMSADYCRLAEWRTNDRNQLAKVLGIDKTESQPDDQLDLFGDDVA